MSRMLNALKSLEVRRPLRPAVEQAVPVKLPADVPPALSIELPQLQVSDVLTAQTLRASAGAEVGHRLPGVTCCLESGRQWEFSRPATLRSLPAEEDLLSQTAEIQRIAQVGEACETTSLTVEPSFTVLGCELPIRPPPAELPDVLLH